MSGLVVVFTGTKKGMTPAQFERVGFVLRALNPTMRRHGCCAGADQEFHFISSHPTYMHPSREDQLTWAEFARRVNDVVHPIPKHSSPEIRRNHIMVDRSQALIAAPASMKEVRRSGTWATVRYARDRKLPHIYICWPDGTVTEEHAG
jgi:hypothetical protein